MLNRCEFIGHLGSDPEVRQFANGGQVANFRLAVTERWKDKGSGEKKEKTVWVPVSIFNDGLVRIAQQYLRKGSKVFLAGKFDVRSWQDKDGNDRYTTEIVLQGFNASLVLLDGKPSGERDSGGQQESFDQDIGDSIPF